MSILNKAFVRDKGRCAGPVYVPKERYSFYINTVISDANFPHFRLDLLDALTGATIVEGVGKLERVFIDDSNTNYNIYISSFTFPNVGFGVYRFGIYDTLKSAYKVRSNIIFSESSEIAQETTALLTYRHSANKSGILYEDLPDFYNRVRYPLMYGGFDIQRDMKQYRNVSDRKLRNLKSYSDYVYTIISYRFDEIMHRAIAEIYEHDTIFINNAAVITKTAYQIEEEIRSLLSNGRVQVVVDEDIPYPFPGGVTIGRIFSDEFALEFS